MSLAKIQEAPEKSLILLVGAPGTGKSTFCYQVVAKSIAADRPVIFVTSERGPAEVIELLSERGVGRLVGLNFVDAFTETVGLTTTERPDTVHANCADLNTLSIAVTRLQKRMGGAKVGKEVGERLMNAGLGEDEAVKRVIGFLEHCKVGKVRMDETVRIRENCQGLATMLMSRCEEPCCFFTTGFLNGLFSAVKNQHVREIKCIAAGDPYCEWEIV